jgi:hypothetical protein
MTSSRAAGTRTHHGVPDDDAWCTCTTGWGSANWPTGGSGVLASSPEAAADPEEPAGVDGDAADPEADAPELALPDAPADGDCPGDADAAADAVVGVAPAAAAPAGGCTLPVTTTVPFMFGWTAQL